MRIKLNPYDKKSVDAAIRALNAYKRSTLETRCNEFIRRLADIGLQIASMRFETAEYDGDNDVSVYVSGNGNSLKVIASGQAVCFIEFGSGVARGSGYPEERRPAGIVGLGEWGKGHGATGEPWYYAHGKKSDGNPPAMAMLNARDTMVEMVTQIAMEVFG